MLEIHLTNFESVIGPIVIASHNNSLIYVGLREKELEAKTWLLKKFTQAKFKLNKDNELYKREIEEYLLGQRKDFSFKYQLFGTEFQLKVWHELTFIPYASTVTYKQIANKIGYQKGYQAVGQAIGKNPLSIVVPCHRVVGSNGQLTGYTGGLELKQHLLQLETAIATNNLVNNEAT